jgi:predicted aldo/keto reductase-like oxidoreductase
MNKIRLGKTGMEVTQLGFGGIPVQRDSEEEAVAIVKRCIELGITYYDTANGYTTSEERIGKAIKGKRQDMVIATKSHSRTKEGIIKDLNLSLQRLGTDYIDLYQFHGVSDMKTLDIILDPDGPMMEVKKALMKGIIRHIGITSHQIDVAKKAVQTGQFETIMFGFNFLTPEVADELIPLARKNDVGFIAMKPLAGGVIDNAAIAIKYLFQFPDIVVIPGIEKIHEIDEIAGLVNNYLVLSSAEQKQMDKIKKELGARFCHRCDYCQPCTASIPISTIITVKMMYKRQRPERLFNDERDKLMAKATECTECEECEKRCPYHLPIREMLSESLNSYQAEKKKYLQMQR